MINIIIWPLVVLLLVLFFYFIRKYFLKMMKFKVQKFFLPAYLIILLLATIIFYIVQPEKEIRSEQKESTVPLDLYSMLHVENPLEVMKPFQKNEWEVPITDGKIKLTINNTEYWYHPYILVLVIEDDEKKDNAYVSFYETPSILNGIDISEQIKLPRANVVADHVVVEFTEVEAEYKFYMIKNIMTVNQFTTKERNNHFHHFSEGEIGLILVVPTGTAVVSDMQYFEIIRK